MTRALYSVIAAANPTVTTVETAINALLAPLTSRIFTAFDLVLTDKAPASTRFMRLVADTETTGAATLTSPFLCKTVQAEDEASAISLLQAFMATIPAYFISSVFYLYSDQMAGQSMRVVLMVIYCADAAGGATNWQIGGGGGGGGSTQFEADLVAGTTVISSYDITAFEGFEIYYVLTKGNVRYTALAHVTHDGTTAYYSEDGIALTPGTLDVAISFDVSAGSMRMIGTASTTGWTIRYYERLITTITP